VRYMTKERLFEVYDLVVKVGVGCIIGSYYAGGGWGQDKTWLTTVLNVLTATFVR
jgi:hypothetical protein